MSQYLPRIAVVKDNFIWLRVNMKLHQLCSNTRSFCVKRLADRYDREKTYQEVCSDAIQSGV